MSLATMLVITLGCAHEAKNDETPTPETVDELRQSITEVLTQTQTLGASVVLVSKDTVLWTADVGMADRAAGREVAADTMFRAGSISKSFVALAVLKLQEEGQLHLDDRLRDVVDDVEFTNPWEETDPVRLAHVLEHTAGFDDLPVRDFATSAPDISLRDAVNFDPRPRTSRWLPGRFFSYSNAGPPLAAYAVERVSGRTFERYVEEEIFAPLGMKSASFLLTDVVATNLATGYQSDGVTDVPYWHVFLRPAGALNTTAGELAHFVQLLLNRGTYQGVRLLKPESIDRMESPCTSDAARQGLRAGYGLGNFRTSFKAFRFQGHAGGMRGFNAVYGYAPDHDVGYVIMINSDSSEALQRIDNLVRAYLTRNLAKPALPRGVMSEERLQAFAGFYEPHTPRFESLRFLQRLLGLQYIAVDDRALRAKSLTGPSKLLLPVDDKSLFRGEDDPVATVVFQKQDGDWFLHSGSRFFGNYRWVPAWWVWGQGTAAVLCLLLMLSAVLFAVVWGPRKLLDRMRGVRHLSVRLLPLAAVICLVAAFGLLLASIRNNPVERLGNPSVWSVGFCVLTWLFALTTVAGLVQALRARRWDVRPWVRRHALLVSVANVVVLAYLAYWGILGLRLWA